jgi:iron complex transport system substrate-binding protein
VTDISCRFIVGASLTFLLALAPLQGANGKPTRIVSTNLCTDEFLLRLADPRNIASVTWLARQMSPDIAALAAQVPVNHGLAEEIVPLHPDLVLAGPYTARTAIGLIRRSGIPVTELDVPSTIAGVRQQFLDVGDILGARGKAERIVSDMDQRLAGLAVGVPPVRPRAIVLNPNGLTVGPGTLADDIITRAGLENLATRLKIDNYGQVPLETIVTQGVDLLIVSASRDGPPSLATEVLRHPVLARIAERTRTVVMPTDLWLCGSPAVVDAVSLLARAAAEIRAGSGRTAGSRPCPTFGLSWR